MIAALLLTAVVVRAAELPIIPQPLSETTQACSFTLNARTAIVADDAFADVARQTRLALSPATGYRLPLAARGAANVIELRRDRNLDLGAEGYSLEVTARRVRVRAAATAGAFYGLQTLRQMLPPDIFRQAPVENVAWTAPCARIEDKPRFSWRGALLDPARHFLPKEFLFKYLDLMALYKLNTFQLHLTDSQGWRVEIKRYPRLTEIGGAMDLSALDPGNATRAPGERAGGYYTQDDIREIVAYAAARHITIVPEIEMPGHAGAAILAYPELGNHLGGREDVYNVDDATIRFLENVLDEVCDLFPGQFIHIGGDEVAKEPWKSNPAAQRRMRELGLKNEEELQSWFVRQFDGYLASKGKRLIGWDEILEGGLAPGAAVTSWRGVDGGVAAAKSGHDVVMNPSEYTYLDYYQSKVTGLEPKTIGQYLPLEKAYRFEPVPPALSPHEAKHVLGGQTALWGEFVPNGADAEYKASPRLQAFAESVWTAKDGRDFPDFMGRLDFHFKKLDALGARYRAPRPDPSPVGHWAAGEATTRWAERTWDVTPAVGRPGLYRVLFQFEREEQRLDVQWIELLEDGKTVLREEHAQSTGGLDWWTTRHNLFSVLVQPKPGASYTLRASVRSDNPAASAGDVYVVPIAAPENLNLKAARN